MKNTVLLFFLSLLFSCNKNSTKQVNSKENYPEELAKVFDKHGEIDTWKKAQVLSFNIADEAHTIDLKSRKTVINSPTYSMGFDGKEVWLNEDEKGAFKGNPTFYHNLYFYFYAMPFVLADDGIIYEKVDDLVFEGNTYPGYKISYKANVGTSPDDNYIIYYHPETYQMEWLAYTITFSSKKPNQDYHLIKYDKWENVNGLVLPKELVWYQLDDKGMPTKPAKEPLVFTLPLVSEGKLAASFFEKPVETEY